MLSCEECGVEIRANTHKPPIWGVATYGGAGGIQSLNHTRSHYFCSEKHGNIWIEKHPEYKRIYGTLIDEAHTTH